MVKFEGSLRLYQRIELLLKRGLAFVTSITECYIVTLEVTKQVLVARDEQSGLLLDND